QAQTQKAKAEPDHEFPFLSGHVSQSQNILAASQYDHYNWHASVRILMVKTYSGSFFCHLPILFNQEMAS
ncbi:MAG: hypothetical protein FWC84_06455, partial [Alphaproteobacteria bacterium]|nr:hypothetical protein [Alphaproteobacteria bacterium]